MSTPLESWFPEMAGVKLSQVLIRKLDLARTLAGFPFVISSSFRLGDPRSHGDGYAVDLQCEFSRERFVMIQALQAAGFRRIGIYPRHIHVDVDGSRYQDVIWYGVYPSKEVQNEATEDGSEGE